MADSGRPLTAKEKRQEQLRRWENSATDVEPAIIQNSIPKVKFHDGAVFLAACSSGDLKEVQKLLDKGADINHANIDGLTALHQACIDGNLDVVSFLVEHNAGIDQEDNEGWTPLHAAASCGFMDIAKYLIEKEANVAAVNSEGEVPLDIAEEDDMINFLQQEIDNRGLDIERARNFEREQMTTDAKQQLNAISRGDSPCIYRHPISGATALHVAAAKGYINVIKILLQAGMDVNLQDNDAWTPLHAASHWSQEQAAKLLADRNADFDLRSKLGQTAFDVADEDMLEYLEELQEEQEKNRVKAKESNLIEPPSIGNDTVKFSYTDQFSTTKETKFSEKKTVENSRVSTEKEFGVSRIRNQVHQEDDASFSSEEGEGDSSSSGEEVTTKPVSKDAESKLEESLTQYRLTQNIARTGSANNIDSVSNVVETSTRLKHSASGSNVASTFSGRRNTRPASLHISTDTKDTRPAVMSAFELSSNRPIAAAQPIQASKSSNGPVVNPTTPTERNNVIKENSPDTWRSGLRKTGSFDKVRTQKGFLTGSLARQQDADKTSSKTSEESASTIDSSRTARVAPILDGRYGSKSKQPEEGDSATERYSATDTSPPKRDESPPKEVAATFALGDARPDRRRSHLQPVRDEEAEAQRKARSRRERQSRRSTQGVTLDVVEEAKKSIENKKRERTENAASAAGKKTDDSADAESTIPHIDSNTLLHRRLQGTTTTARGDSGTRPVSLPSAYIPSSQRVGATAKTAPLNATAPPPTINVLGTTNDAHDKSVADDTTNMEDDNSLSVANQSVAQRKSAAQQRRRQRKERRSTGLPELRPSDVGGEVSSDSSGQHSDLDSSSELMDVGSERVGEKEDSETREFQIKPSSSPKPTRRRRSRSGSDRAKSPENARPSRKVFRPTEDDDPDYTALVKRLQERIRKRRPQQTDDVIEHVTREPDHVEVQETTQDELSQSQEVDNGQQLSFVDMFSFANKPQQAPNETNDDSHGGVIDASPCDVTKQVNNGVVHDVACDEVADIHHDKVKDPISEAHLLPEDGANKQELVEEKRPILDERAPLLHKPQEEKTNEIRRRTHSVKNNDQSGVEAPKGISTLDAEIFKSTAIQRAVSEASLNAVGSENVQGSIWKRFLGIFGCFVIFCGVWKCFSK